MMGTPVQNNKPVNPFIIPPQTPKTDATSQGNGTPRKFKSPNSMMKDLTQQMMSMDASMKSPAKDDLNMTVNPQSKKNK